MSAAMLHHNRRGSLCKPEECTMAKKKKSKKAKKKKMY